MKFWRKTPSADAVSGLEHAQAAQKDADEKLRQTVLQGLTITRVASTIAAARAVDPFSEDIQITFTRKDRHA